MAENWAQEIVAAHHEIERQTDELERAHRTEEQQLQKLQQLQHQHTVVTQVLRDETERAESAYADLRRDIDTLIDGIHEVNSRHRQQLEAATT